jgi:MoxR-like ATPase
VDSIAPLSESELTANAAAARALMDGLGSVVLGQPRVVREVITATMAGGHLLLEGPPGTAKTLLVRTLQALLGLSFRRIQFTPDLMPADVMGISMLGADGAFRFRPGPIFADLVLADEINRAPAKTQAALLEAMEERSVTVDGDSHALPRFFTVFATQNPIEFEGTYPLPEAELDRFIIKCTIDWPEPATEEAVLAKVLEGFDHSRRDGLGVERVVDADRFAQLRAAVRRVSVERSILAYITAIVAATRGAASLTLGASPRASLALLRLAQAAALLDERDYVVPDDVKQLALPVLRHRVMVAPELELEGVSADSALRSVIDRVEAPGR